MYERVTWPRRSGDEPEAKTPGYPNSILRLPQGAEAWLFNALG
jgi:hypothetical protein